MEDSLISKKELLELTNISYGQLYRWKRKNLIPEDWFIRKSTFTGQETFFYKDKILERIDKILHMKDRSSLDELADLFSPYPGVAPIAVYKSDAINRNLFTGVPLQLLTELSGDAEMVAFDRLLALYLAEQLQQTGGISLEEGRILLQTFGEHYGKFDGRDCDLVFIRKADTSVFFLLSGNSELYPETHARLIAKLSVTACIEQLKVKLS